MLLIPIVGFLPQDDARIRGTIDAIQRELMVDGLIRRYRTETCVDGLPAGEGAFLACSFWLVDCLYLQGRIEEARAMFERLLLLRNDVGLLSEEYDTRERRLVGNFPQAFSHVGLISSAMNLSTTLRVPPSNVRTARARVAHFFNLTATIDENTAKPNEKGTFQLAMEKPGRSPADLVIA